MNITEDKMRVTFGSIKGNSKANKDVKIKPMQREQDQEIYNVNKITVSIEAVNEQKPPSSPTLTKSNTE